MKDVKYDLDPSVLLETLEKLSSYEECGCSNLVDGPVTTVYLECWLTLAQVRICLQKKWRQLRQPFSLL